MLRARSFLSQNPTNFNELLDLFEGYIAAITKDIETGHDMLREEIGAGEHVALGLIFGAACDNGDMIKRLQQYRRAHHNVGGQVSVTLSSIEAAQAVIDAEKAQDLVSNAASALQHLEGEFTSGRVQDNEFAVLAIISLARRALEDGENRECEGLRRLARKISKASSYLELEGEAA